MLPEHDIYSLKRRHLCHIPISRVPFETVVWGSGNDIGNGKKNRSLFRDGRHFFEIAHLGVRANPQTLHASFSV